MAKAADRNEQSAELQEVPEGAAASVVAAEAARSGVNADFSNVVSDEEAARVIDSFHRGEMEAGYRLRFVTRGGEAVGVVTKIG